MVCLGCSAVSVILSGRVSWGMVCLEWWSELDEDGDEDEGACMLHVYPVQEKDDNKECVYCVWGCMCVCVCSLATCEGIEPLYANLTEGVIVQTVEPNTRDPRNNRAIVHFWAFVRLA